MHRDSLKRLWIIQIVAFHILIHRKMISLITSFKDENTGKFSSMDEMSEDKNGNFWLTTSMGLIFFNTHTRLFSLYQANQKNPDGLASNGVHNLFTDHSGTLWLGTAQIGVQWSSEQLSRFIRYKDDPGQLHHFPGGVVNSFAESKDSTIWLGSARGLYHWRQQTDSFTLVRINKDKEKNLNVNAVIIDKDGLVWCGASGNLSPGLYCYDPKSGKSRFFNNNKKDTNSLSNNYVGILLEDHLGISG